MKRNCRSSGYSFPAFYFTVPAIVMGRCRLHNCLIVPHVLADIREGIPLSICFSVVLSPGRPIMPIQRLDERPDRTATLQDITCDSDGKIANFVTSRTWHRLACTYHQGKGIVLYRCVPGGSLSGNPGRYAQLVRRYQCRTCQCG